MGDPQHHPMYELHTTDLKGGDKKKLLKFMSADELGQTAGLANFVATVAVALRFPQFFWIVHVVKALIYLPWRFVRFRRDNCELFLLDFCYVSTYLTVVTCLLAFIRIETGFETFLHAYNWVLIRAQFTFANGALAWSIIIFKNSIVFYNIDQMCSVFIHLSPAIFCWCLRWGGGFGQEFMESWWPGMFDVCPGVDPKDSDVCLQWENTFEWCHACPAPFTDFVLIPVVLYMVLWAVPYNLFAFCCFKGWIERNNKDTLYKFVVGDPKKSAFIRKFPEQFWPLAYMMQHFITIVTLGCLTTIFWHNFFIHCVFGAVLVLVAIHNGSTYTFRVFALRYADGVLQDNIKSFGSDSLPEGQMTRVLPSAGHQSYSQPPSQDEPLD